MTGIAYDPTPLRARPPSELIEALAGCSAAFAEVKQPVLGSRDKVDVERARTAWDDYYGGPFRGFDAILRTCIERGAHGVDRFVPLSISHHNLGRLFEVLAIDSSRSPEGQVPAERLQDLVEMVQRLGALLELCQEEGAASG